MRDHACLARSGSGQDEQRALRGFYRSALFGIEMSKERMQGVESGGKVPDSSLSFAAARCRAHVAVAAERRLQALYLGRDFDTCRLLGAKLIAAALLVDCVGPMALVHGNSQQAGQDDGNKEQREADESDEYIVHGRYPSVDLPLRYAGGVRSELMMRP